MIILKIIVFVPIAVIAIIALSIHRNKWAVALQRSYIRQANKLHGNSDGWDRPWILTLFKFLVIVFGFMFIIAAYSIIFSIGCEGVCQSWQ